jgi:cobalamin biosynthesis Mg chelatase CobN
VTLRVSGLFHDAFETQMLLFDSAVQAIAARDEPPDWNRLAAQARGLSGPALREAPTAPCTTRKPRRRPPASAPPARRSRSTTLVHLTPVPWMVIHGRKGGSAMTAAA